MVRAPGVDRESEWEIERGEQMRTHMHADRKVGPGRQTKKDRSDKC